MDNRILMQKKKEQTDSSALFISRKECEMQSAVKKTLQSAGVEEGDNIVVAVSGGIDSLVLLDLLRTIADEIGVNIVVCHVDHQMRAESAQDAKYVSDLCERWQIRCHTERVDVWARVRRMGESPEEAARNLRYEVLGRLSQELGGAKVVLAHHQDDQAETVLLHLLRGTGLRGLGGMRLLQKNLIRPLLPFKKQELEKYAAIHDLIPCEDVTNYDTKYLRNRIRHQLLPELESCQPQIRQMLCRLATLSQEDEDYLEMAAESCWHQIVTTDGARCEVDRKAFCHMPIAMQRRLVRRGVQTVLNEEGGLSFAHSERLRLMIIQGHVGAVCPLKGKGILRCDYEKAIFSISNDIAGAKVLPRQLIIGENVVLDEVGIAIQADIKDIPDAHYEVWFDAEKVAFPLHIRSRRMGDVIATCGKNGKKKLKKELIDCKIAVLERDKIPIVCDANDTILWVVGVRTTNVAQVNSNTKQYLCLKSEKEIVLL